MITFPFITILCKGLIIFFCSLDCKLLLQGFYGKYSFDLRGRKIYHEEGLMVYLVDRIIFAIIFAEKKELILRGYSRIYNWTGCLL